MIKFETESGTIYYLDDKRLKRVAEKTLWDISSGQRMDTNPDWEHVTFVVGPEIGQCFQYYHPTLYRCVSTPVVSIEEV